MFYGWKIGALSLGGNLLLSGASVYCINAFMEPLCEANGWTRGSLNFGLGVAALMGQLAMPLAAAIALKISTRLLMTLGALAGGLATCAMGFIQNLHLFTIALVIFWVSSQFCGGVVGNALMSNWFSHYRGIALGMANSGTSLAGMILPMLCLLLIAHYGLAVAYLVLGIATWVLGPLCWILVRDKPQDLGLWPDGRKHPPRGAAATSPRQHMLHLLKRPAVWCIGIAFGLSLMTGSGIMSQLKPRFADLGIDDYSAMWLTCLAGLFGVFAKYFWGWACDRTTPVFTSKLIMGTTVLSMLPVFFSKSFTGMAIFGLGYSSCVGGMWVVLPAVTAYYFGAANFLGVYKLISFFILLRCLGFPVMGLSWRICSSYELADLIFTLSLLASFVLTMFLHERNSVEGAGRPRRHGRRRKTS